MLANGSRSASVSTVLTSSPRRLAEAPSSASIPAEMSVAVARSMSPSWSRLSEKYPVPAPISSASPNGRSGHRPSALPSLARTCARPVGPKSIPHFASYEDAAAS